MKTLVLTALFGLGGVGLLLTGFIGFAAASEMLRQCPHGADCADARSVTAIAALCGGLAAAMAVAGAAGLRSNHRKNR